MKMIFSLGAVFALLLIQCSEAYVGKVDCSRAAAYCPQTVGIVCGSNGVTYINDCYLKLETCNIRTRVDVKNIVIVKRGPCSIARPLIQVSTNIAPTGTPITVTCVNLQGSPSEFIFQLNGAEVKRVNAQQSNSISVILDSNADGRWACQSVFPTGPASAPSEPTIVVISEAATNEFITITISDPTPKPNHAVVFTCNVNGDRRPMAFMFLRNGKVVGTSRRATYTRTIKIDDAGMWSCTGAIRTSSGVVKFISSAPVPIILEIQQIPVQPFVILTVFPTSVNEGQPLVVSCASTELPGPTIFTINGQMQSSPTPTLFIPAARITMDGVWTCSPQSSPLISGPVDVEVIPDVRCERPSPPFGAREVSYSGDLPGDIISYVCLEEYTQVGGQGKLQCGSDGSWTGHPIVCKVALDQPILVASDYVVVPNTEVELTCVSLDADSSRFTYIFINNNGRKIPSRTSTIVITPASRSETWTCQAVDGTQTSAPSTPLEIQVVPGTDVDIVVAIRLSKVSAAPGERVTAVCDTQGSTFTRYLFLKDGIIIKETTSATVTIIVNEETGGMFTCVPFNTANDRFLVAPAPAVFLNIIVGSPNQPSFTFISMRPDSTMLGSPMVISCSIIGGTDPGTWEFRIKPTKGSSNSGGLLEAAGPKNILIKNADENKEGVWICKTSNSIPLNEISFVLEEFSWD